MRRIRGALGSRLRDFTVAPKQAVTARNLLNVHTADYLGKLHDAGYLAVALEVPLVAKLPASFTCHTVLRPMRWACAGTMLAGELALQHGLAINMSGGYHHAKPDAGEGFCIYNDVALLIHHLRSTRRISDQATIAYVDLDVHQGNGVCHCFLKDSRVAIFDMFNRSIYPAYDHAAHSRIDHTVAVDFGCGTTPYLERLGAHLPRYLDQVTAAGEVALVIYVAGTDILAGDPLGGLNVSREGIVRRDALVVAQARSRNLPCVMLLGGGYTQESHEVIADSVAELV